MYMIGLQQAWSKKYQPGLVTVGCDTSPAYTELQVIEQEVTVEQWPNVY